MFHVAQIVMNVSVPVISSVVNAVQIMSWTFRISVRSNVIGLDISMALPPILLLQMTIVSVVILLVLLVFVVTALHALRVQCYHLVREQV